MKILILGGRGYIGEKLGQTLLADSHEVVHSNREVIDFDSEDSFDQLSSVLSSERPRVVINAVGKIDSKLPDNPRLLFNAILLPTYYLLKYYSEFGKDQKVHVCILGSNAAGEPRAAYPLYAALKAAEIGLSLTASELFARTEISWDEIIVPRLLGGLGRPVGTLDTNTTGPDKGLDELADTIRKKISILPI